MHKLLSTPFYVNLRINVYFIHFVYILGKARIRWRTCGPKNQSMGSFWHAVRSLKDTKHICKYTMIDFFLKCHFCSYSSYSYGTVRSFYSQNSCHEVLKFLWYILISFFETCQFLLANSYICRLYLMVAKKIWSY